MRGAQQGIQAGEGEGVLIAKEVSRWRGWEGGVEGGEGGGLCISVCVCHQFEHVTLHDADTQNETNTTNINDIYLSVLIVSGWVSLFSLFVSIRGVIIGMGVKDRVLTCLF